MGERELRLVRQAYRAFSERDLPALEAHSHPDVEVHTVTALVAGAELPYRGPAGLARYLADVEATWDEIELTPQEFTELGGGRILVSGRVRVKRGRALIDTPNAWLWELEDGLVRRVRILSDPSVIDELQRG